MKLNIGCGADTRQGYINLDYVKTKGVDAVHDLEKTPYPFKDNTFDEIVAFNILEHIRNLASLMEDIHRIGKNRALVKILVPHYNQHLAYTDPSHVRFFSPETFNYFAIGEGAKKIFGHKNDDPVMNFFTKARYRIIKLELKPGFWGRFVPFKKKLLRPLSYVFGEVVESIYVELEVLK